MNDNIFEDDDVDEFIYLNDASGKECRFEFLDLIDYNGHEYVVLLSDEEASKDESEVDILEVTPDPDNPELETYITVEDDNIRDIVFKLFADNNKDIMDFC